jgi:hypothetical protein
MSHRKKLLLCEPDLEIIAPRAKMCNNSMLSRR